MQNHRRKPEYIYNKNSCNVWMHQLFALSVKIFANSPPLSFINLTAGHNAFMIFIIGEVSLQTSNL